MSSVMLSLVVDGIYQGNLAKGRRPRLSRRLVPRPTLVRGSRPASVSHEHPAARMYSTLSTEAWVISVAARFGTFQCLTQVAA